VRRLALNPDLLICWREGRLLFRDLSSGRGIRASPEVVTVLDLFRRPRTAQAAARALPGFKEASVLRGVEELARKGLLLPAGEARRLASRVAAFRGNVASAHYHAASRDLRYIEDPSEADAFIRERVLCERRPPRFKRYDRATRVALPRASISDAPQSLDHVLRARRTVRAFASKPVLLADFSTVVRGTWGRTGWLPSGVLGRMATKTSPSAGALHPVECYVLVWKVRGLRPGVYHYDVGGDELRRLKTGNPRDAAVRAASGQRWVRQAAFLCVMTAVFSRTLWKYRLENAYRSLWLDAGHLAQTFCLLATSRGLGPFTTAAMQDSFIEKLIGLDSVAEFPVYLCGAGVPARRLLE
jgi:SagB-type dehydrogenase family enzyme